ncbi:MAG: DUF2309 domain-containing protein [Gammaproteobacteria bacterium]
MTFGFENNLGGGVAPEVVRAEIRQLVHELDHVLPGQAPIQNFVHHNTLHGFQHLPFDEALAEAERLTGVRGYLPDEQFRECYRQGRITEADLLAALRGEADLHADQIVCSVNGNDISRAAVYRIALLFDLEPIGESQLQWNIEEMGALDDWQGDVPKEVRKRLLAAAGSSASADPKGAVRKLWDSLLKRLDLGADVPHPECMLDLSLEQAEEWLAETMQEQPEGVRRSVHEQMRAQGRKDLARLMNEVGDTLTLRGLIQALTGIDILDAIRPQLIRICASALDEGLTPWQLPDRHESGLYGAWRKTLLFDANPFFHELPDWPKIAEQLGDDAIDTLILQLSYLEIPRAKWGGYLRRLALEMPGWAGMINWRQQHPEYHTENHAGVSLADYLAIRMIYDRLWLNQICRDIWKIETRLGAIDSYFRKNLSEFMVRHELHQCGLPEYLTQEARTLIGRARSERNFRHEWQELSDRIRTWQLSPCARREARHYRWDSGWRLFRLAQHLGLGAEAVEALTPGDLDALLGLLQAFSKDARSRVWLRAYELHYREDLFRGLAANRRRLVPAHRKKLPEAQLILCMDEREESFRRHLEELNPGIETLGAAGFFGIPMFYQGLDDSHATPLCPVVITPAHRVDEVAKPGAEKTLAAHRQGHQLFKRFAYWLHQSLRRHLVSSHLTIDVLAPFTLLGLLGDMLTPGCQHRLNRRLHAALEPAVPTDLRITAAHDADKVGPKAGFSDSEQADRVEGLLRTMGLTDVFAPIVCMIAHGSTSLNNPHEAAHDCGACGGRRGGPNARVFAAMANRPEVRALLAERGIVIPHRCWFVGAQHDTCNDELTWYDLETIPPVLRASFEAIKAGVRNAQALSAHERCRRFMPATAGLSPEEAFRQVKRRASDLSQVRPEFGHASNAAAIIGRRTLTRGLFLDRRAFLISYDAAQDADGRIVENILLTAGQVGAGISLEYYFSTVDNDRFGCGTKIPHNITGMFGVMEGASSDLRTGLPLQMVEIHEAMRLQVVVEAKTVVLEQIYQRQEPLRELIANGWIHLSAIDPESGEISVFERGKGFMRWQGGDAELPVVASSLDAYRAQTGPVAPVLIKQTAAVEGV